MKRIGLWLLSLVPLMGSGQTPAEVPVDPIAVPPQATIVVRKHATGADLVEITMLKPDYPMEVLRERAETMGQLLRSPVRGLTVYRHTLDENNPKLAFVKATFATDGLINRESGTLGLQPIIQAFAGIPSPNTIHNVSVSFADEKASQSTVRRFLSDKVALVGRADEGTIRGVEYRVALLKQDPDSIQIPARVLAKQEEPAVAAPRPWAGWLIWSLVAVAALATGALVYFAVLRPGRRPSPNHPR